MKKLFFLILVMSVCVGCAETKEQGSGRLSSYETKIVTGSDVLKTIELLIDQPYSVIVETGIGTIVFGLKMKEFNAVSGIGSFEEVNGSTIHSQASIDKEGKHFIIPSGKYKVTIVRDKDDLIIGVYFKRITTSTLS